jgi:hypothetical protein
MDAGNTTGRWTIGELFSTSWKRFADNWAVLVLTYCIMLAIVLAPLVVWVLATGVIGLIMGGAQPGTVMTGGLIGVSVLAFVATLVLGLALYPPLLRISIAAAAGERPQIGDLFRKIGGGWKLANVFVAAGLLAGISAIFLFVPGLIVALGLSLATCFAVDTDLGVGASLKASWETMRGSKWRFFVVGVLMALLQIPLSFIPFVSFAVQPFMLLMTSVLYVRLRSRSQAVAGELVAAAV